LLSLYAAFVSTKWLSVVNQTLNTDFDGLQLIILTLTITIIIIISYVHKINKNGHYFYCYCYYCICVIIFADLSGASCKIPQR